MRVCAFSPGPPSKDEAVVRLLKGASSVVRTCPRGLSRVIDTNMSGKDQHRGSTERAGLQRGVATSRSSSSAMAGAVRSR